MKKILVVDDEPNIRDLYREEFEGLGFAVVTAACGEEALSILEVQMKSEPFSLVTLDMRMAGIDGIETLRRIKKAHSTLAVVIVTGYEEYKNDFGTWCSEAYFVKSSNTRPLTEHVNRLLS